MSQKPRWSTTLPVIAALPAIAKIRGGGSSGMKVVSSRFTSIQFCLCINLLLLVSLRRLCCHGLLQARPTEWYSSGPRSRSRRNHWFPIYCSATFDHSTTNTKSVLEKAGGISYRQSVCTPQEINSMQNEISLVMKRHLTKERSSIAQNRLGATLTRDQTSETIQILEDGSIYKLVQRLADSSHNNEFGKRKIELAPEIPVEVRLYEQVGASMAWHRDDIMYDPPQLEAVFTLENNSDCVTMWKMQANNAQNNEEIHSQETNPNSLLLLLAGGPDHCVTSLKRGRRAILKCAYVYAGATYVGEEHYYQFGGAKGKGNAKKVSKAKKRKRDKKR